MNRNILAAVVLAAAGAAFPGNAETLVLQQGVNGYTGCSDKELREQNGNYYAKVPPSTDVMLVITGCPYCPTARAAVKFDLSQIPMNAVVSSARLEMYAFWKNGTNAFTITVAKITRPWSAAAANWTQRDVGVNWTTPGGDYGTRVTTLNAPGGYNVNVWDVYNVTSAVQDFVANPSSNYGLLFMCTGGSDGHGYRTSEYATVSQRPKLTIVYSVPTGVGARPWERRPPGGTSLRVYQGDAASGTWLPAGGGTALSLNGRWLGGRAASSGTSVPLLGCSGVCVNVRRRNGDVDNATVLIAW